MNNAKISVLACLTLALCALGSVEAKNKRRKKGCDLVGAFNVQFNVTECGTMGYPAGINSITVAGVAKFHKDCTAELFTTVVSNETMSKELVDYFRRDMSSFKSVGVWKQIGPCDFKVCYSTVVQNSGAQGANLPAALRMPPNGAFRVKTVVCVHCIDECGEKIRFDNGTISFHALEDRCFCLAGQQIACLTGEGCRFRCDYC